MFWSRNSLWDLFRKGPVRERVTHQIMNIPKKTHCGLSINMGMASSPSSSSGNTGASFSTVVSKFTVLTYKTRDRGRI